ncbi:SDR family oxidoreductase [Pontibacterium sp. N1Y112]|uniref:SDR family oxidoreductase n=1 Tax=Pontibacterium sinense TaxID=2781979 RepID=A0A8J7F6E2_9GAMM|nr:SDR family oxidoreductase [Pontibacterium sinense]MBE9395935.1 SDR family oxidoreductase [Pontibacterium sinense]
MNVLLTGANGFLGRALKKDLESRPSITLSTAYRSRTSDNDEPGSHIVGDIDSHTDWAKALEGVNVVIHCAARVHVMNETEAAPEKAFRSVNVHGTVQLARQAIAAGVSRFIFISTIKVNGDLTARDEAFYADDVPCPSDAYAQSKWEAEQELMSLAKSSGLELVIIRPPLVYGPGVKANFLTLLNLVDKGIPLPLGAVDNSRSIVFVDNLVDLIVTCVEHQDAANQVFLISDSDDVSTAVLIQRIAHVLGAKSRLFNVPVWMLIAVSTMLGKRALTQRLCESLTVDTSKTVQTLGWSPPYSLDEGLKRTVEAYKDAKL